MLASTGGLLRPRARARCRGVCDRARVCVFDFVCSLFALCLLFVCSLFAFFFVVAVACFCFCLFFFFFCLLAFCLLLFCFFYFLLFYLSCFRLFTVCLFCVCLGGLFTLAHDVCMYMYVCVCCVCGVCAYLHFRWGAKTLCGGLVLARVVACVIVFYCCFCA